MSNRATRGSADIRIVQMQLLPINVESPSGVSSGIQIGIL